MSNVPAWKRFGLKVTGESTSEPVVAVTHYDGSMITNKFAKKINKKRQLEEDGNDKTKKAPKKVKKPKAERGPPPEKDQLFYLKQFTEDKETWKFSKQKQNWLLKNIEDIPQEYENYLIAYFEDIQGGARKRVEDDLRVVIINWNEYSRKLEDKINAELYGQSDSKDEDSAKKVEQDSYTKSEKVPSKEYALRCKKLLSAMLEEPVYLEGEFENVEPENEIADVAKMVSSEVLKPEAQPEEEDEEDNLMIDDIEVEDFHQRVTNSGESSKQEENEEAEENDKVVKQIPTESKENLKKEKKVKKYKKEEKVKKQAKQKKKEEKVKKEKEEQKEEKTDRKDKKDKMSKKREKIH